MTTAKPNKRITLIEPRQGMALTGFHAHWSGVHAEIARDLPGLVWYVQNHVLRRLTPGSGLWDKVHGIAEIAFRNPDAIYDTIDTWARVDELREDETRFIDQRIGNWAILADDAPMPSLRRVVIVLDRLGDGNPVPADLVDRAVAGIRATLPCHLEKTAHDVSPGPGARPDGFIFVELPATAGGQDFMAADGPILRHLHGMEQATTAFLVYAEAKRLPLDLDPQD